MYGHLALRIGGRWLAGLFLGAVLSWGTMAEAWGRVEVEAIPGRPFGVARLTAPVPRGAAEDAAFDAQGFALVEQDGRVFYPTFTTGPLRRLLDEVLGRGGPAPGSITALFLFTGDAPLDLTLYTPSATKVTVTPRSQPPRAQRRLLQRWWREYHAAAREQLREGDYPPLVETYLTTMLSGRLGLEPPLLGRIEQPSSDEDWQTLELLLGVEPLRAAIMRETMRGRAPAAEADQAVPGEPAWAPLHIPRPAADVEIEPIAMRVPEECFYIRFGRFSNYLWFNQLLNQYGGEISNMVRLRGHNAQLNQRMQQQLALEQTVLADLLGDAVIADVALLGRDLYLQEGAALGVLFQARNAVLGDDLRRQRNLFLRREKDRGATLENVQIGGRDVSLLSTPDNRLRSFYVNDGPYHLVSTSRVLIERFLEAGQGTGALGAADEFRHARSTLPVARGDTVFLYFSSAFFRSLVGPQYQIELARRLRASTDLELVQLAKLAAQAENRPAETIEQLVEQGLLPPGFTGRIDGSRPVLQEDRLSDSLRGGRGSFLPITDVPLEAVSRQEAARYAARAAYYQENWRQMDPLMIGIRREVLEGTGRERIVLDAHVSPLDEAKYGRAASMLAPATAEQVSTAPGDVISVQAVLRGGQMDPHIPPHHLFLGVQDSVPRDGLRANGLLQTLKILQTTPGYLGAWPKLGLLDRLPLRLGGAAPDPAGYSPLPLGLWRRQWDGFSVLSFDRPLLDQLPPHLTVQQADTAAQIRVQVEDLSQTELQMWVNALNYQRAQQASVGNARLLHTLSQQLHVPRDEALTVAQRLLDTQLVCTLGGEYQLVDHPSGMPYWQSTQWSPGPSQRLPDDYQAPLLEWFRGLQAHLTKQDDRLVIHAQLEMQRRPVEPRFELPGLDLFRGRTP